MINHQEDVESNELAAALSTRLRTSSASQMQSGPPTPWHPTFNLSVRSSSEPCWSPLIVEHLSLVDYNNHEITCSYGLSRRALDFEMLAAMKSHQWNVRHWAIWISFH